MKRNLLLFPDPISGGGNAPPSPPPVAPPATPADKPAGSPPASGESGGDPFASIDSKLKKPPYTPPPATPPPEGQPKPSSTPPATPPEPKTPKELRDYANRNKEEAATLRAKVSEYERQLADFDGTKREKDALMAKASSAEDRIKSLEQELGLLRFQASPEFKTQYEDRFNSLATSAKEEIDSLQVGSFVEDETGARVWKPAGQASFDKHFATLYNLNRPEARQRAKELFGPEEAETVMNWYSQLHTAKREMNTRLDSEKRQWEDTQKKSLAENATRQSNFHTAVDRIRKDIETKFPEFYQAPPDDTEAAELLKEGWKIVDMKPATFDQAAILNARVKMNAASAPMLQHLLTKAREENALLKQQLESASTKPGQGGKRPTTPSGTPPTKSWEEEAKEVLAAAGG